MSCPRLSLRQAVNAHCRACIYDPLAAGAWREQVAACTSSPCALFDVRPVPRDCTVGGCIDPVAVAAVRAKLDSATGARTKPPAIRTA